MGKGVGSCAHFWAPRGSRSPGGGALCFAGVVQWVGIITPQGKKPDRGRSSWPHADPPRITVISFFFLATGALRVLPRGKDKAEIQEGASPGLIPQNVFFQPWAGGRCKPAHALGCKTAASPFPGVFPCPRAHSTVWLWGCKGAVSRSRPTPQEAMEPGLPGRR